MEKISQDVKALIQDAIRLEINGQAFFNEAAALTHNELLPKVEWVRLRAGAGLALRGVVRG